jgi:hypothetical protein
MKNQEQNQTQQDQGDELDQLIMPLQKLFSSEFMTTHTRYESIDALLAAGGYNIKHIEDFSSIPEPELNNFIAKTTKFQTWHEALQVANTEFFKRKLGI